MEYSQDIKIFKTTFKKHELLKYYNDFLLIISQTGINPIQLSFHVSLSGNETYDFSNIEDFKNEVCSNNKIKSVMLVILTGIDEVYSICLSSIIFYSTINFSSDNKAWVDDIVFRYKLYLKNQDINILKNNNSAEEISATTEYIKENWLKNHENLLIGLVAIITSIIIAILGWTVFKK